MKILKNAPSRQIPAWQSALLLRQRVNGKIRGAATFVCLKRCPNGELEALEIAKGKSIVVEKYPST